MFSFLECCVLFGDRRGRSLESGWSSEAVEATETIIESILSCGVSVEAVFGCRGQGRLALHFFYTDARGQRLDSAPIGSVAGD